MNKVILLEAHVVIDGRALLHPVFWSGSTFKEVINEYRRYASSKCKICQIGFDGCKSKTTKVFKHARRETYNPPCADVLVDENATQEDIGKAGIGFCFSVRIFNVFYTNVSSAYSRKT